MSQLLTGALMPGALSEASGSCTNGSLHGDPHSETSVEPIRTSDSSHTAAEDCTSEPPLLSQSDNGSSSTDPDFLTADPLDPTVEKVRTYLGKIKGTHNISQAAIRDIYKFFVKDNSQEIAQKVKAGVFPCIWTLEKKTLVRLPKVLIDYFAKKVLAFRVLHFWHN